MPDTVPMVSEPTPVLSGIFFFDSNPDKNFAGMKQMFNFA